MTITSSNANGASLSYTYDADDRLATVADNRLLAHGAVSGITSYRYDAAGNLINSTYPNTVQTGYTYDTLNRLSSMKSVCDIGAPGCNFLSFIKGSFTYTLGPAGNRATVVELSGRNVGYGYDNDYRQTSETISGDTSQNGTISYTIACPRGELASRRNPGWKPDAAHLHRAGDSGQRHADP